MSYQEVYNFEKVFETAVGSLCANIGLTMFSSQGKHVLNPDKTVSVIAPDLQRDRPRFDFDFRRGSSSGRLAIVTPGDVYDLHRQQAWTFTMTFSAITEADPAIHFSYLALLRNFLATLPYQLNADNGTAKLYLPNHHLHHPMIDQPDRHEDRRQEGFFLTHVSVSGQFSILPTAWAALSTP